MSEMLDISYWQGKVTQAAFATAKAAGIDRVILRASRADGALAQDSTYATSVANARAAGLSVGHYHFNGQSGSVAAQAQFFCDHINVQSGDVLVLDIETEAGIATRYSAADAVAWLDAVKARYPGAELWVYMSQSVTNQDNWTEVAKRAKLWVASYTSNLGKISYWSSYVAWQYTSSATQAGFAGRVDRSRYSGTPIVGTTGGATPDVVAHVTVSRSVKDIQAKVGVAQDGIWGPVTQAAVITFQKAHGLTADGIWGPQTDAAAFGGAAQVAPAFPLPAGSYFGPKSGPAQSISGYFSHRADLQRWQQQMKNRGWTIGVDGLYGDQTASVTKAFQKEKGLAIDGLIGPATWTAAWTSPVT